MTCKEDAGHLHGLEYDTGFHVGDDWVYPVKTESAVIDNTDPSKAASNTSASWLCNRTERSFMNCNEFDYV